MAFNDGGRLVRIFGMAVLLLAGAFPGIIARRALAEEPARTVWLDSLDISRATQGWGQPQHNLSVDGHPMTIAGRSFEHGFGTHSVGVLVVDLNRGSARFTGAVGLDDETLPNAGSVAFRVIGDGRLLWDSGVMRTGDAAKPFDIDVHSVKRLQLTVTDGGDAFNYDHADWADARFTVTGVSPVVPVLKHAQPVLAPVAVPGKPAIPASLVWSVRPGTDLVFAIPATGKAPLRFSATGLPAGVSLDEARGILTGRPKTAGAYPVGLRVRNALGETRSTLRLTVGQALAPVPPMGWNSYDAFGDSVTEAEVLANARTIARDLLPHGWRYVVVDYRWYDAKARSAISGMDTDQLVADAYGRLQPAPNRFPSAAKEKGFKPLADQVHEMGLLFGIHVMRGIPRLAVERNTPIFGSPFHAADAANTKSTCGWCADMFGVRGDTAAGQAWYDSIIRQYAAWGVDYLKIDDLSSPYSTHEIEAIRKAIDKCGRSIVLSLSPGPTPLRSAEHVSVHANAWRISGDLWDNWRDVDATFDLGAAWAAYAGPGHWPDADMLPLGRVGIRSVGSDRRSQLNRNEQVTMITLWSILRSPLMLGGNQPDNDPWTRSLLSNDEVIAVSQDPSPGAASRVRKAEGLEVWSRKLRDGTVAVALFNRGPLDEKMELHAADLGLPGATSVRELWRRKSGKPLSNGYSTLVPAHGSVLLRLTPQRITSPRNTRG